MTESESIPLDKLDALLARWEELKARGNDVSLHEFCGCSAEVQQALQARLDELAEMDWLDDDDPSNTADSSLTVIPDAKPTTKPVPMEFGQRYHLDCLIASGGFGQVWRATDTMLERQVALKVTSVNCLDEARRVAGLKHQGIVSVHDVGFQDGFCFIVFDYIAGGDLSRRLKERDLSWREVAVLVAEVADNVQYAHDQGIIHRDIKPANILLDDEGHPVLADFGIAMTQQELDRESATTAGTLVYMAPEQLTVEERIDHRTDIHALGVVLYELLTGRLPYRGNNLWDLRSAILTATPDPLTPFNPEIPETLDRLTQRCLEKDPNVRWQSASDLARELRAVLHS